MNPMNKVLIVDDEAEYLEIYQSGLQKYEDRFEVLTALGGKEAIEVLKKENIAVLVTDLIMPEVGGLELLAHMTRNYPTTPCIVLTGYDSPELREIVSRKDILQYITKPIDFNELAIAIIEGIDRLDEDAFKAGVSTSSILQLINVKQKTCLLEVRYGTKKKGFLYFVNGILYDAVCNDLKEEDAALEMIGWEHADFRFKSIPKKDIEQRIFRDHMSLIKEKQDSKIKK
jgi:YesN/AraC family two-component response regulator